MIVGGRWVSWIGILCGCGCKEFFLMYVLLGRSLILSDVLLRKSLNNVRNWKKF